MTFSKSDYLSENSMLKPILSIVLFFCSFGIMAENYIANKDYMVLTNVDSNPKNKVHVMEFFSYGCPWCYKLEQPLMNWVQLNQNSIRFERVPVVFNKEWTYYAKAYYVAKLLRMENKLTPLLFQIIQAKQHALADNQEMINFFISQGVDPQVVRSAFENSTTVNLNVNQSMQRMSQYHIASVPAVVVNNQYKIDLQMAQSEERFFKILNFLVEKVKKE